MYMPSHKSYNVGYYFEFVPKKMRIRVIRKYSSKQNILSITNNYTFKNMFEFLEN